MILIAIAFWLFIGLSILGLVLSAIDIWKGKSPDKSGSLPEPIRKALGHWF